MSGYVSGHVKGVLVSEDVESMPLSERVESACD